MRVAVYSGAIPSTTFIEHLIHGLADCGSTVLLFGTLQKNVNYGNPCIKCIPTPLSRLPRLLFALKVRYLLKMRNSNAYCKLNKIVSSRANNRLACLNLWARYAPILLHKPKIFHLQWAKSAEDWLFLREFGIQLIISFRGTHINTSPLANATLAESYRRAFPHYDAFHAVSSAIAEEAEQYGANQAKIHVIRPAIDAKLIKHPIGLKDISERRPLRILSVGRNHWIKGYRYALDSCKELKDSDIGFEYTIIGGSDCEALLHQRDQLGLNDQVDLQSKLPHADILRLYKTADLFLLPSLEEGIANVVLEAMALGCPVLTSDCGGMKEVIEDGINGLIFPSGNVGMMARKIEAFLAMPNEVVHKMRLNARETIQQRHLLQQQIESMAGLYKSVIKNS